MRADSSSAAGPADDDPVDRYEFAGLDQETVAGDDRLGGAIHEVAILVPVGDGGRSLEQGMQVAFRATLGISLERLAGGVHHRDHGTREVLAERDRPAHRQQRDDVDTGRTGPQRVHDPDRQADR